MRAVIGEVMISTYALESDERVTRDVAYVKETTHGHGEVRIAAAQSQHTKDL
jgi:hypothetical protein